MQHPSHGACCGCALGRREFLATTSVAAVGATLVGARPAFSRSEWDEYIDIGRFRPRPRVRALSAIVRMPPPYWLGWPGTSYDVSGAEREYGETFAAAARRVGVELAPFGSALENEEAVGRFVRQVQDEKPDAVLVMIQHIYVWRWVRQIAEAGVPTLVFSPVGMAFTGQVKDLSRRPGVHVISSLDTGAVEQGLRMVRAKKQLEATRLLVVAGKERKEEKWEGIGTTLQYIPRNELHELFAQAPVTDEMKEIASHMRRRAKKVVEPSRDDLLNAARSYVTAKRLLAREQCHALTTDCLGMVSTKVVPTPPCMAASIFQDHGVTYGCEADRNAALSLLLVSYLFDKPGFMNDPVPETVKNLLIAAHCTCGTRLNGFDVKQEPYILRSHSESDIGVSMQVLWKEGQKVTLALFDGPEKLIIDTGTVVGNVATPPAGGCRTSFEIAMDRIEDCRDVLGFHQVVFYGDHRRDLLEFCQMFGITPVHSPEHTPAPRAEVG